MTNDKQKLRRDNKHARDIVFLSEGMRNLTWQFDLKLADIIVPQRLPYFKQAPGAIQQQLRLVNDDYAAWRTKGWKQGGGSL